MTACHAGHWKLIEKNIENSNAENIDWKVNVVNNY